ncbi:MAG: c-type cytochrome domain-containing protein [Planctomycetales bacterium]
MRATPLLLLFIFACVTSATTHAADAPTFEKHVAPFFKTYCLGCHDGGDDSQGGLSLLTHKSLMAGGDGGEVVVAGKSADSRLVQMLLGNEQPRMPPKDSRQPKPEEIELIKLWVDTGAKPPTSSIPQSADELTLPRIEPKVKVTPPIASLAYSPNGRWLAAARHREVLLFDASSGNLVQTLTGAEHPINAVAFSANSQSVAAAEGLPSVVGKVRLWNLEQNPVAAAQGNAQAPLASHRTLTGHADSIYALAFSPDGTQLVTASYDKLLILWDVVSGAEKQTLKHHTAAVFAVAFSPDGKSLASVAADQTVKIWNVATGQRILTLTEPTKPLSAVAFHPQGHELAAVGADKMIRIYEWNGSVAKLKRSAFAHDAPLLAVAYSPDGATLFTAGEDRRIKAWDVSQLHERHVYDNLADWPLTLALHPSGDQLAAGLYNGELLLLDPKSPNKLRNLAAATTTPSRSARHERLPQLRAASKGSSSTQALPTPATTLFSLPPLRGEGRGGGGERLATQTSTTKPASQNPQHPTFVPTLPLPLVAALFAQQPATEPQPNPPTPRLDAVSPRTVVRGNKVKFTLSGQNISAADQLFVSHTTLKAALLPPDEKNANAAFCEIDIPADMPPGMVSLRLHTPLGTAGSRSFYVGPFPESGEKEPNSDASQASAVSLPTTLVGTINARGDRDFWSFEAQSEQELVFLLIGPTLGSSLQARMTLLDPAGRVLARGSRLPGRNEVVLGHKFGAFGKYVLQVEDRDNTGGGNHFYYIHAGAFPYVTGSFPFAMRAADLGERIAGEVTAIDLTGFNLAPNTRLTPIPGAATRFIPPHAPTGKAFNTARYEATGHPEFAELEPNDTPQQAQPLPIPGGVSGRIAPSPGSTPVQQGDSGGTNQTAPGDADLYAFEAKQGQRLTIETIARRIGSPIDTVLEILDATGKPVPRHTLRAVAETYTVLRDHESRSKGIRLQAWDNFQCNDFILVGAEVLKLQIMPLGPDEDVKFFDRLGPRQGFFGTTPQAHAINTPAYKVEVHPPGSSFPPNGMPLVLLDWANDDAPGLGSDSQVLFDVPADGKYLVRVRDVRGLSGDEFAYRLVVRPRQEDFRISLDPENPNIPRGGSLPVTVTVDRLEGFNGHVDVRLEGLPPGITATTTRIGPDLYTGVLTLTAAEAAPPLPTLAGAILSAQAREGQAPPPAAATGAPAPVIPSPAMKPIGSATIGGALVEHATTPGFGTHHLTITSPPDLRTTVEPSTAQIAPGQELRFTVTIERRNGFKGRVPVDVLNLPHGLRVLDVGLNGVLINEEETSRSFVVACDPWAEPGPVTFYAAAKVEAKNERHAASPILLEVRRPTQAE